MDPFRVVICGAGIAGVEGLLRLRRLAGDRIDAFLLSPEQHLDYRPLAVLEPFGAQPSRRYPVERIVTDAGATWICDSLSWVDRHDRVVHATTGQALGY